MRVQAPSPEATARVCLQPRAETQVALSEKATEKLEPRAFRRLEDRGCIVRSGGRWILTDHPLGKSGVELALLAWAKEREFYARFGLAGPPLETLGVKPKKEALLHFLTCIGSSNSPDC